MGKKIKPKSILLDQSNTTDEAAELISTAAAASEEADSSQSDVTVMANVGLKRKTPAEEEKLEKYDGLEKTVTDLQNEKAMLESKLTSYIEKLASAKDSTAEATSLKSEVESLKSQLEAAKEQASKAKHDAKTARDEADRYLVKISDLAFENAKLTAELNDLKSRASSTAPDRTPRINQQQFAPQMNKIQNGSSYMAKAGRDPYNPYANNGYGSW